MDVTPLIRAHQKIIQSYAAGQFRISGEMFTGSVIVGFDFVRPWTDPQIEPQAFAEFSGQVDVLIIGTGATASFVMPAVRQQFRDLKLPVEMMDTGAACRTFNVLTAEGRQVVAALKAV